MPIQMGPYQLGKILGRGGMGTVYAAWNVQTGEAAAVKVLPEFLMDDVGFRQRFDGEIEVLRKLRHPNIVRLLGFGEQDRTLFYAMELVEGASLQQLLRNGRRFSWQEVVEVGVGMCRALRHAHDRGVVHRDIKPANVLLAFRGGPNDSSQELVETVAADRVRLADFGIAQLFGEQRLTAVGAVVGTVEFMAPEQAAAEPVGPRSDLYSLGAVLFTLLIGQPPFLAKSLPEILKQQRQGCLESLLVRNSQIPRELDEIVRQLLRPLPHDRPPTADVLRRRLEQLYTAEGVDAEPETRLMPPEDVFRGDEGGLEFDVATLVPPAENLSSEPSVFTGTASEAEASAAAPLASPEITHGGPALDLDAAPTVDAPLDVPCQAEATQTRQPDRGHDGGSETANAANPEPAPASEVHRVVGGIDASKVDEEAATEPPRSRFISVRAQDLDPAPEKSPPPALLSAQTWILISSLLFIGFLAWRFLQPPTADQLSGRIMPVIADGTMESYRRAERDMADFVSRFPDDPRGNRFAECLRELELSAQERRFERRIGDMANLESLLPIERAYLEAITESRLSPERGLARLAALVDLYELDVQRTDEHQAGPAGVYVELARRRIVRLNAQIEMIAAQEVPLIRAKLDRAAAIEHANPARARAVRQSVITLYADKPWAVDLVARAQASLQTGSSVTPNHDGRPEPKTERE